MPSPQDGLPIGGEGRVVVWTEGGQGVAVVGVLGVTTDDEGEYRWWKR